MTIAADTRPSLPAPLQITTEQAQNWGDRSSWQYGLARRLANLMPRGKGWFPRVIGKLAGGRLRDATRTASGARLAMHPGSLDVYCAMERAGGHWDLPVLNTCLQLLSPGQVFYDIGANVGYMAIEAASRLGDKIRTYAFEPQPELARNVAISAALNGLKNVQVFTAMLGREPGEATLFIPSHSIHASAVSAEAGATAISCPMTTIDELVQGGVMAPPDVIKIDVEGAERDVFEGARRTLTQHRSAIVFESDRNAERFGYTRRQLCDLLRQMADYVFYDIPQLAGDHAKPRAMEEAMFDDDHFNRDLLALPSGRTLRDQVG